MTTEQLQLLPSYEPLKRNGLTDENIRQFYSLDAKQRGAFLNSFKNATQTPTTTPSKVQATQGTQKCTGVSVASVRRMALEHMEKDYVYRGKTFNPKKEGWKFEFNNRKRALGLCSYRKRTVYLSTFFINQGSREMKMWVNTMVHEIAHGFAKEQFGERGHGWLWKDMFMSFGGDGQRCNGDAEFGDLLKNPVSKYTMVCDTCNYQSPSHKIKKRKSACSKCCDKHNGGRYSANYVLRQVQNY